MFDFIKTNIKYLNPNTLEKNPLLSFQITVDSEGVIKHRIAEYNNFKFKIIDEKYININGSVHKYFNSGLHNYNDFTIPNLVEVFTDLSLKFDLNPLLTSLHNLEFGVNVIVPYSTNRLLNSIISYKGKEYEVERYNGKGYLLRFSFDHYDLKIYNKGLQYQQSENILRFEIKVKRMEYFRTRDINIKCLSDLLNTGNYIKLMTCLLKAFSDILIYDNSIRLKGLTERERAILINGKNPKYWSELVEKGKDIKYKRNRFNSLVAKYGKQNIKETILKLIENKFVELSLINTSTQIKIKEYLNQFQNITYPELTTFKSANLKTNLPENNYSNKGLIESKKERKCLTCGNDITNQKNGSVFCSEKIFGKEAKKCRNQQSNPKNNYERKEAQIYKGALLFDITEYKQQRAN